jgi:hypothetical protein
MHACSTSPHQSRTCTYRHAYTYTSTFADIPATTEIYAGVFKEAVRNAWTAAQLESFLKVCEHSVYMCVCMCLCVLNKQHVRNAWAGAQLDSFLKVCEYSVYVFVCVCALNKHDVCYTKRIILGGV